MLVELWFHQTHHQTCWPILFRKSFTAENLLILIYLCSTLTSRIILLSFLWLKRLNPSTFLAKRLILPQSHCIYNLNSLIRVHKPNTGQRNHLYEFFRVLERQEKS